MCSLFWALIPSLTDNKEPHGNHSYVTINRESRGQMNAGINPKGSCGEVTRVVSWHVVDLDLILNLLVVHELSV